jgi:hypothetical protein
MIVKYIVGNRIGFYGFQYTIVSSFFQSNEEFLRIRQKIPDSGDLQEENTNEE